MITTWWKRCYEGLRGARFVSPFILQFHWPLWCWVVLCLFVCLFVCLLCFGLFVCLLCFGFASENSAFN